MEGKRIVCRVDDQDDATRIVYGLAEAQDAMLNSFLNIPGVLAAVLATLPINRAVHDITTTEDPTLRDVAFSALLRRCT